MGSASSYEPLLDDHRRPVAGAAGEDPHEYVDPFTSKPTMTALDWAKVAFNTLWLLPLRLLLLVIPSFAGGIIVCILSILGDRLNEDKPQPLRGWRRFMMNTVGGGLARVLLFGMGFHWVKVRGSPAPTAEAPIMVVSPHSSIMDMFLVATVHLPTYVSKADARHIPLLGYLITHAMRTIFVNRNDPSSRRQCTAEIERRAKDSASGWPKVMIFPEGTTHNRQVHLQFKKGAFLPGLPVQAVVIKFHNRCNSMVWADRGIQALTGLYLTLCQVHNHVELEFLPVHRPTPQEMDSPELFAENVRREIGEATGIPLSNYALEDLLMCRRAEKLGLPYRAGLVSFSTVQRELRLEVAGVKRWLQRFSEMDTDRDGFITSDDFCRYLAVPADTCTEAVFDALCKDSHTGGKLSFRRYLYGVMRLSLPFTTDEALTVMFQFFDTDADGIVSRDNICSRLPLQWTSQSQPSDSRYDRGTPPPHHRGCGCKKLGHTPQQASLPPTMTLHQFCEVMREEVEYVLLFQECQTAAISSPSTCHHDNSCQDNTPLVVTIET